MRLEGLNHKLCVFNLLDDFDGPTGLVSVVQHFSPWVRFGRRVARTASEGEGACLRVFADRSHLPLRGKLGWMTPRASVKTTLASETHLRGSRSQAGAPFFLPSSVDVSSHAVRSVPQDQILRFVPLRCSECGGFFRRLAICGLIHFARDGDPGLAEHMRHLRFSQPGSVKLK